MPRLQHVLLPALALVFLIIYQICLADLYKYEGMIPIRLDVDFWLIFISSMFIILLVFPTRISRPSDLFVFFYILISVLWGTVLWGGTGLISVGDVPVYLLLTMTPVFALFVVRSIGQRLADKLIFPVQLPSSASLPIILVLLLLIGGISAFTTIGSGSFDWQAMYVRRLAGRDAYAGHVFAAYATNMASNGILPLLGFVAGYRRSILLTGLSAVFILMMFFLLGLKSPAINFVALAGLGFCFRYRWTRNNLVPLTLSVVLVVYVAALARFALDGETFLADYLVRRISMVQPQLQSYYFDYWLNGGYAGAFPNGAPASFGDTTFTIGYLYLHNPETNANSNAFFYALGKGGLPSYFAAVIGVTVILTVIDLMAEKVRRPEFYAVVALFSILVAEQAWTTVLLTSGIALCLALVMLFSYPSPRRPLTAS